MNVALKIAVARGFLDVEEARATAAAARVGGDWRMLTYDDPDNPFADGIGTDDGNVISSGDVLVAEGLHIEMQNPVRTLRRIAQLRDLLTWCEEVIGDRDMSNYGAFGSLADLDADTSLAVTFAVQTLYAVSAMCLETGQ